jgi:pyruvate carboxylase
MPALNSYWENVRSAYAPFESGQLSGSSDVYDNEIPGGQCTNLLFQSRQLGLSEKWPEIKQKYAEANKALGDIPEVTPSSKVVGDLAQFMAAQNLSGDDVVCQAESLALPDSVVNYLRGDIGIGIPPGGFPEPLRTRVLTSRNLQPIEGRPGASLRPYDFEKQRAFLEDRFAGQPLTEKDLLSYALYPEVYVDWKKFSATFGEVSSLPTNLFLNPMKVGDEVSVELGSGRVVFVRLSSIQEVQPDRTRTVIFGICPSRTSPAKESVRLTALLAVVMLVRP